MVEPDVVEEIFLMEDGNHPFENDVVNANLQLENQQFDQSLANVKLQLENQPFDQSLANVNLQLEKLE